MNPITFGTKRAFHGFLRFTRKPFASVGLTAARFDMLLAIHGTLRGPVEIGGIAQCDLPRVLGVSKSVVSRMLKALLALDLIEYCRDDDRRFKLLWLSEKGMAVFGAAKDLLMRSVQRVALNAISFGRHRNKAERRQHQSRLTSYLAALRVHFGDKAPLDHDWTRLDPDVSDYGPPAMMLRDWPPAAGHGLPVASYA
jgi:DNA-binding MarR family transcriptional regulator